MKTEAIGRFLTFATIGALNLTQELAGAILQDVDGAEPDLVAEETICLVATATARAAEVGLREHPAAAAAASSTLLDLPFIYRDYLLGGAMLVSGDRAIAEAGDEIYERLQRKREFYAVHLPADQFPGERALKDKMDLWMGRVSPPKLPEMPSDRLARLDLIPKLVTHLKLVLAYGRKQK